MPIHSFAISKLLLVSYGLVAVALLGYADRSRVVPVWSVAVNIESLFTMHKAVNDTSARNLVWQQDFAAMPSGSLNGSIWRYELDPNVPGYNNEAQAYTARQQNIRVEQGKGLVITAREESYHYPDDDRAFAYTSGRIDTRDSFSFTYGTIMANMKLPRGSGTWPAFWLLSANEPYSSSTTANTNDPRLYLKDGELDIMEAYGSRPGIIEATAHSYNDSQMEQVSVPDFSDSFHDYAITVRPDSVTWSIDGQAYFTIHKTSSNTDDWPFGAPNKWYPILNLALGGPDSGPIDNTQGPWTMTIRNIRYHP